MRKDLLKINLQLFVHRPGNLFQRLNGDVGAAVLPAGDRWLRDTHQLAELALSQSGLRAQHVDPRRVPIANTGLVKFLSKCRFVKNILRLFQGFPPVG